MRIATWNVNSIRSRIDRVTDWLVRSEVDILAIQETKCKDAQFPYERFTDIGYEVAHVGTSQWNGVAIASRVGLTDVQGAFSGQPGFRKPEVTGGLALPMAEDPPSEARAIAATCNGVRVWSLYVPNGRELTDAHYEYKLAWLEALRVEAAGWLAADPSAAVALMGDWNVAPTDEDVWDPVLFEGKTHTSERERRAFEAIVNTGYADVVRPFTPGPGVYTFWDYTQLRFPKKQGLRIDFVLASPTLGERVIGAAIDREERKGKGASDHAPVVVELS